MTTKSRPRTPGGLVLAPLAIVSIAIVIGCWLATEYVAEGFADQPQLGAPLLWIGGHAIYPPFDYFVWLNRWNAYAPHRFDIALFWLYGAVLGGILAAIVFNVWRARGSRIATTYGSARWADQDDIARSGLIGRGGVVLGRTAADEYVTHDGPEHVEVTAPSRSGKGVGIVVPTLLTWPGSVIVNDIKGENWTLTAGHRRRFGYVLAFNPSSRQTCRFNPLMEIRAGDFEVRDAQNICDMIVDPEGKGKPDHWSREADAWLLAVILHVLYAEPDKTLGGIARFLNDPDRTIQDCLLAMLSTPHRDGRPHPVVAIGARAMLNKSANERSGVHSTARSFFSLYLDPVVASAVSESDFRIADLMQAEHPVSLYLISPPSDKARLRPLFRLLLNQFCRRLTEELHPPANRHRLLLLLDEFPSLGRLDFFEDALGFVAGYGLKCLMINQSTNQIVKYYGQNNTVMDGAHVHVYFAPNTEETARKISDLLGTKTQVHTQENFAGHRLAPWLGHVMVSRQQTARALLTPGEVRELPPSDEIVIVAGLPPIRAKKLRFHADRRFKNAVPPTDAQGRLTDPAHPRNPPTNLAARPYPYGPPVPKVMWSVSHAKSVVPAPDEALDELDREHGADSDLPEPDLANTQTQEPESGTDDTDAARRAYGLEQDKRRSHTDPDPGWNL
ncbi:MAG: conjugal transfer protein TraG [Xanthomonadales bacterium PRO7]|nr:conjugal transfer protein TraG [Xanthomonadales bacterium PRO7]